MTQTKPKTIRKQTIGEEIANSISHGVGGLLSIAGTVIAIVYAAFSSDAWGVVSVALYGASLIILYTASTLYHSLTNPTAKRIFQIFDHCSIFILILGTYIPVSLSLLRGWMGWTLFGVNAACTVLGIVLNSISLARFKKISMIFYIIMGWSAVFAAKPIIDKLSAGGIALLLLGGLCYTIGIIFYKNKKNKYMHFIWHFFVLAGSVLHYFCVLFYCI